MSLNRSDMNPRYTEIRLSNSILFINDVTASINQKENYEIWQKTIK